MEELEVTLCFHPSSPGRQLIRKGNGWSNTHIAHRNPADVPTAVGTSIKAPTKWRSTVTVLLGFAADRFLLPGFRCSRSNEMQTPFNFSAFG